MGINSELMKIQVTFQDGPIEAEITAEEDEDYDEALETLADFVDGYDIQGTVDTSEDAASIENEAGKKEKNGNQVMNPDSSQSNPLFDQVDATESEIHRIIKTGTVEDGEVKELPEILGNTDILGSSKEERLLNGSVVILSILDGVHDISRVKTSEIKDALSNSGIDEGAWGKLSRTDNEDVYLDRRGKGPSATTELRPPGKEDAMGYIQDLIDDHRADKESTDE